MKIAVISDIHENIHNLIQAVKMIQQEECEAIFCLGDVGRSKLFEVLFTLELPVYFTFGNHDGNVIKDTKMLLRHKQGGHVRSNGLYQKIEIARRKIFITHYDELARIVAKSGEFDACFGGHEHLKFEKVFDDCLCVNPGEITGTRTGKPGFYIYDTQTNSGEFQYILDHHETNTPKVREFLSNLK